MRTSPGLFLGLMMLVACSKDQAGSEQPNPGPVACTEIGCVDGLRISLEKATPWAAGDYTFALELDGAAVTCTGSLPLKACDTGPSVTCAPAEAVMVAESGCALGPETHGFSDVQVKSAPKAVSLKISHAGQVVHEAKLTPEYTTSRPNGEGCEPTCTTAGATVKLN